jgi:mutator protein MutT
MGNNPKIQDKFYAGGFLYNPDTNEVLLHRRDNKTDINPNKWAFFGGLNEAGETPSQTFIREIREELNIEVSEKDAKKLTDYLNEELQTYRYVFFALSHKDKSEMRLSEGADFDWISLESVFDYDLTEKTKLDLEFFLEFLRVNTIY